MEPDKTTQTETPATVTQPTVVQKQPVTKSSATSLLLLLLVVAMAVGAGAYWWRDKQAKDSTVSQQAEITALQKQVAELEKKPAEEKKAPAEPSTNKPSDETIANIKASVASGNYAALEGYMAASVNVIRAATDGPDNGPQTPAQAIKNLEYLKGATDPWNFELPAATLAKYRAGDYKQFFPESALVGKSANNYVVSFTFNSAGKISGIFMSVSADLL